MKALRIMLLLAMAPVGIVGLVAVVASITLLISCIGAARIIVEVARSP